MGVEQADAGRNGGPGRVAVAWGGLRLAFAAWLGALRAGAPRRAGVEERLAMLATGDAPVERPVRILWNERQVPFVEAETDHDLAVGLGVVHAHLRLAQIEMMRRVATGRLAEVVGAPGVGLDRTLRTMNFLHAGRQAQRALSAEARTWADRFIAGLNHQIATQRPLPHEFEVLGIEPAAWSLDELMAVSRLASTDFTWRVWLRLMKLRGRADWRQSWARLIGEALPEPSLAGDGPLADGIEAFGRPGSNAYAVGGSRTASGKPIMAGDPHLAIQMPNLWIIVGMKSPGYHAVGLMVPAVPALGLGRNRHIAWGGTNLHAASSELVRLDGPAAATVEVRTERIRVRWGRDREVGVRDSAFGPVISDAPLVRMAEPVALHWMGHRPSDELTALLRVARATDWASFRAALAGYAVPGLNMICADAEGGIGQTMAATLPRRPMARPTDIVSTAEALDHWRSMAGAGDLPVVRNPPEGFVASANDAPPPTDIVISRFFSPGDRIERLREVLGSACGVQVADLARLQQDVASGPAARLRDRILPFLRPRRLRGSALVEALVEWDGRYAEESAGALAFELIVDQLIHRLHPGGAAAIYAASWDPLALLGRDLDAAEPARLRAVGAEAVRRTEARFRRLRTWGGAHRIRLGHPFRRLPLIGRRYRVGEWGVGGGNETLMKTRHGFSGNRHVVGFGAQARHISDMADLDANHFVLLGGQDGWLGSTTFADQVPLWREGRHLRVPLRPETVRTEFRHVTTLAPPARGA